MMSGWGYSESPLVDGNKLVCTPGGKDAAIVALDKQTGRLLWKTSLPDVGSRGRDGAGYSSIVISEACGIRQYVQMMGRGTISVAADNGRFLWGYNRIANDTANITAPIVTGDYVFCTTSYGTGSALLRLTPTGDKKGIQANEVYFLEGDQFQNHHGGLVLLDGYIYGGHGQNQGFPTCIELKTGKILWKQRGPGGGSAAVTYADGNLYFRYEDGVMALIQATPKALNVESTFKLPTHDGPSWPYPVIAGGMLYLRHGDSLLCYDLRATRR
jgi:outer membrane protein assembly factor BamB